MLLKLPLVRRHGLPKAAGALLLKLLARGFGIVVLRWLYVARTREALLQCPRRYAGGFLGAAELRRHARQAGTELTYPFLHAALARGDECYAFREGDELVAYGWYARGATPIGVPDLEVSFDPGYVYMYKGYTAARHRGARLHAIGKTRALRHYQARGCRGLLSYVEAHNLDSLRSAERMGAECFGLTCVLQLLGRSFAFSTPGCRRFGLRLERPARAASPRPALSSGRR